MVAFGAVVTTTETELVLLHPVTEFVSTKVYVVLITGDTVGFASVEVNPAGTELHI